MKKTQLFETLTKIEHSLDFALQDVNNITKTYKDNINIDVIIEYQGLCQLIECAQHKLDIITKYHQKKDE